jgi:aminocarboxymuconate-semialdehyde decarboxylase
MVIDIAAHILPPRYFRAIAGAAGSYMHKRVSRVATLHDLDTRFRIMDRFSHLDYRQVLTTALPAVETVTTPANSPEICRALNEELQELVHRHPDRFLAALGSLPLNNPGACAREIDHIIELGMAGFQFNTNMNGLPLDHPTVLPVLEEAFGRGLAAFMHPARGPEAKEYAHEDKSKFEIWHVFGWPYETTVAMARLVFSGLFDRHPEAVIITHHLGGMVPFFGDRIKHAYDQFGARTPDENYEELLRGMRQHPVEYFRKFYGDTGLYGGPLSIECGVDFFGVGHVLYGSDMPFDREGGPVYIGAAFEAVEATNLSPEAKSAIYQGNARRLLRLAGGQPKRRVAEPTAVERGA